MKRRTTRVERYECGEGKTCSILGSIAGPLISGGLGILGGLFGGGNEEQRTTQQQQLPTWSPEQLPYLFGGNAWQPQQPLMNPYAVNYAGGLSAGYNPAFGPQQPMDFASLLGGMGNMGGAPETPWFMDPGATPQPGGLAALLGIGAGGPPPLLMQSPQFGFGVQNPDLLHQQPGQSLVPSGPTPGEPQPQGPAGPMQAPPLPPPPSRIFPRQRRFDVPWYMEREQRNQDYLDQLANRRPTMAEDRALRGLSGRNIKDLTPEELALLGL